MPQRFSSVFFFFLFVLGSFGSGCGSTKNLRKEKVPDLPLLSNPDQKLRWMQRLSRKLRMGKELSSEERNWVILPPDEIIDRLMQDPSFAMGLLDFNLAFLGFKSDNLTMPKGSARSAFPDYFTVMSYSDFPTAAFSALSAYEGKDHLSLFDIFAHRIYIPPLPSGDIGEFDLNIDQARDYGLNSRKQVIKSMETILNQQGSLQEFCSYFESLEYTIYDLFAPGYPSVMANWVAEPLIPLCGSIPRKEPGDLLEDVKKAFAELKQREAGFLKTLAELNRNIYQPQNLFDLRSSDLTEFGGEELLPEMTGAWFWNSFTNSSTNMDRKRAAYVLKRFLCDDLTPINVELPSSHAGNKHASDPGCQSCHYKLDPLAGFFRRHGYRGTKFEEGDIVFDDDAAIDLKTYEEQWKTDGKWNIGYVRSATDPAENDYSDHPNNPELEDLFTVIRRAPEAKQCVVETLFRHMVGKEVALDRGYLKDLLKTYNEHLPASSALALKETMRKVAKSESFVKDTTEKGICYDFAEGTTPGEGPPCEVAFILETNCKTCHNPSNRRGGLDLMTWRNGTEGRGFSHTRDGQPVPYDETLKVLSERLNTSDPDVRMPMGRTMPNRDREILFKWVNSEQTRPQQGM
ncbi:MAG: hypothetical protein AB7T49_03835 [Oligoflexales bacterium]